MGFNLALHLIIPSHNTEILSNWTSTLVRQHSSPMIANPAMDSSATRKYPQYVLESKIFSQSSIQYFDSSFHEFPALNTNLSSRTTSSYLVIISHININYKLFFLSLKCNFWYSCPNAISLVWRCIENSTYINFNRFFLTTCIFELNFISKAKVSTINIAWKCKWKFPSMKVVIGFAIIRLILKIFLRKDYTNVFV